jgi:Rieske 2Fe-2S family protein
MQAQFAGPSILRQIKNGLPYRYFYDPEQHQKELDVFWYDMWVYACRAEEVASPRDYKVFTVGEQSCVITRDLKGVLRAFHNTCRHRGSILCTEESGRFEGGSVVCPYHAWTYSLEGSLIATPHQLESADFDMNEYSLYGVAVGEWAGYIFVNFAGANAEPLEHTLGNTPARLQNYHMEELKLGKRIVIDVEANWKLLFENFSECFHCPGVHPELCDVIPIYGEGLLSDRQKDDGMMLMEQGKDFEPTGGQTMSRTQRLAPGKVTLTMDGTTNVPFFRDLTEEERSTGYTASVLRPNLFINIHPDFIHTHRMLPTGPTSVQMVYDWLFEPSSMERPDFDIDKMVDLWDITNRQDAQNCKWQQEGLASREADHCTFVPQEIGPWRFHQWVLERLGEETDPDYGGDTRY